MGPTHWHELTLPRSSCLTHRTPRVEGTRTWLGAGGALTSSSWCAKEILVQSSLTQLLKTSSPLLINLPLKEENKKQQTVPRT